MSVVVENDQPSRAERVAVEPYMPDFELGEDVSQQRNAERERVWANARIEGREQLSARETMIKHGSSLQTAIRTYKYVVHVLMRILEEKLTLGLARSVTDFLYHDSGRLISFCNQLRNRDFAHFNDLVAGSDTAFQVCVRVRPLFSHEQQNGEYRTVFCDQLEKRQVTVHEGSLDRSGRRMEMVHHNLMFHKLWDDTVSNEAVSKDIVDPLVAFVQGGKSATVIMYGQTGTGKTYTLQGIFERLCILLEGRKAVVSFIEIDGKKSADLMDNRKPVKLLSDANGNVHVRGAANRHLTFAPVSDYERHRQQKQRQAAGAAQKAARREASSGKFIPTVDEEVNSDNSDSGTKEDEVEVVKPEAKTVDGGNSAVGATRETDGVSIASRTTNPDSSAKITDFFPAVMRALEARTQLITERNPVSSRTHAVCQIRLLPANPSATVPQYSHVRMLTLVDLAGSERKYETMHMSVQEHKRSADINYTLMTLRHVFRTFNARISMALEAKTDISGRKGVARAFPSTANAGPAEMRRMMTKKMTKARAELRKQV